MEILPRKMAEQVRYRPLRKSEAAIMFFGVEDLLGEFWYANCAELVRTTAGEGSEADHEEVETREGNHVNRQLSEIGVELTRES